MKNDQPYLRGLNDIELRNRNILKCFIGAYYPDLCIYNGSPKLGYTMLAR